MLNGQQMGGKRRSAYHYDLWSMKYLPKFKWDHLTEEVGARLRPRQGRKGSGLVFVGFRPCGRTTLGQLSHPKT